MPALRLEMACVSLFPEWRQRVLGRVEKALASTSEEGVMDALGAIQVVSEGLIADAEAPDAAKHGLTALLHAASQKVLWRNGVVPSATINALADVVERHPRTFAGDIERLVLLGLGRLVCGTAIQVTGGVREKMDGAGQDVWMKLLVRRAAARLAYRLFERYRERGDAIPKEIAAWRDVCQSEVVGG